MQSLITKEQDLPADHTAPVADTHAARPPVSSAHFPAAPEETRPRVHFGTTQEGSGDRSENGGIVVDVRKLQLITIAGPVAYLLALEVLSIVVLLPLTGSNAVLRMLVIFALLVAGVVPFSVWVFRVIERQQRRLAQSAEMLDNVKDHAIFMLDPTGQIVTWSKGAERLKGYRAEEIVGKHISTFYSPEAVQQGEPERNLEIAVAGGRAEYEGWRIRSDGSRFWANVVSMAVRDEADNLCGFTHVVRDMTERQQAEERIRNLNDELERQVLHLNAANEAITAISGALDVSHVLQKIVETARDLVASRFAALGVADENGRIVQFITSGITPEEREAIGPLPQGHGLLGALIKEGKPLRVPIIARDPRSHGFPPNHPPMKSLLGVPILFKGQPVGDLYLTDKIGAEEFSQEDEDLLILLANHASVAIENARLYEEVRSARDRLQAWNAELETKVVERTREVERHTRELTTRVLQAQEEERKRIARELHDDTAQSLSTMLINLDLLEPRVPVDDAPLREGFERVRTIVKRTLDSTRALSHDLRPTILDDFGLVAALKWFVDEYSKTFAFPVEIAIDQMPAERLTPEVELVLFRIAQEALTNAGKYSRASCAHVTLSFYDQVARLVVQDDGKGFDIDNLPRPTRQGGLGLYGMQERADLIGANLEVVSSPGKGTRVTVRVPIVQNDDSGTDGHLASHQAVTYEGADTC